MSWNILYRGPLSSCNYACQYCPFAKTRNTRAELLDDAKRLNRFVEWAVSQNEEIGVLFTPWGEAMMRRPYQRAFITLSNAANIRKVAIQTNLTFSTGWLQDCNLSKVAFWTTFHPTQTTLDDFLAKCKNLDRMGARYSVGVVASHDALEQTKTLRQELANDVYLWANAYKRDLNYYSDADVVEWEQLDPLFRFNTRYYASRGRECRAGHTTFAVDGDGDVRRCHFIKDVIANIYTDDLHEKLRPSKCTSTSCGCHIGYVHMPELELYETFGDGLLERVVDQSRLPTAETVAQRLLVVPEIESGRSPSKFLHIVD